VSGAGGGLHSIYQAQCLEKSTMFRKIWLVIASIKRKGIGKILFLMFSAAFLEALSVGLIVPVLGVLVSDDVGERFPILVSLIPGYMLEDKKNLLVIGMALMVFVYIVKSIYLSYQVWMQAKFTYGFQSSLSSSLFKEYLSKPYLFHLEKNSSELYRNVVTESAHFTMGLHAALLITSEMFVVLGIAVLLMMVDPIGTVSVVIVVSVIVWLYQAVTNKLLVQWGGDRQYHDGMRIKHVHQGLGAIRDILMYRKEGFFVDNYKHHVDGAMSSISKIVTMQQVPRLLLEAIAVISLALVVIVNIFIGSDVAQLLPIVAVFAVAAFRMMPSLNRVMGATQTLLSEAVTIDLVYDELTNVLNKDHVIGNSVIDSMIGNSVIDSNNVELKNNIVLNDLSFKYTDSTEYVLKNINFQISSGQMIGLVGESGSGKSTLINLLLGLLKPADGDIYVDGISIWENVNSWQSSIGYVPQDIFLTDDSLRNNIALGVDDSVIDDDLLERVIKQASLSKFVEDQPDGIYVNVGERGAKISGGQKQRIAIARALYHDPQILILDEATSALDEKTEESIIQTVNELHGRLTVILVTHRLSTIKYCDRVYTIKQGLVEQD